MVELLGRLENEVHKEEEEDNQDSMCIQKSGLSSLKSPWFWALANQVYLGLRDQSLFKLNA